MAAIMTPFIIYTHFLNIQLKVRLFCKYVDNTQEKYSNAQYFTATHSHTIRLTSNKGVENRKHTSKDVFKRIFVHANDMRHVKRLICPWILFLI